MKRTSGPFGNERGATIVLVALTMVVMMGAAALAVDIGMLLTARTEAQRVADAAAMAAAGVLIGSPNDEAAARAKAIEYGAYNTILGDPADVWPEDVEVNTADGYVRVTVHRDASHGNPVPTWFARVFGANLVDVSAVAAAGIASGHAATCLKPWAVMDAFKDNNGNGIYEEGIDEYDGYGFGTVTGSEYRNSLNGTSYEQDVGYELSLKSSDNKSTPQPGWYFPWDIPQPDGGPAGGADKYMENIETCNPSIISVGVDYMVENGNMPGPTRMATKKLIDRDPAAFWDESLNQVAGSDYSYSPRIVHVPVFHPADTPADPGKKPIQFSNIIGIFIESVSGNGDVVGRIMYVTGMAALGGGGGGLEGEQIKFVQLIE